MPQIEGKYDEVPRFADNVKVGQELTIIGVQDVKTEKNGYAAAILTLQGGNRLFSIDAGVLYKLGQVKGSISAKDPLKVVVADYKNSYGTFLTIKNLKK